MTTGVYEIGNKRNGMAYTGSSANTEQREYMHFWMLRRGCHHSSRFQRAWDKEANKDVFEFRVLEVVEGSDERLAVEQARLDEQFAAGTSYNVARDATASFLGCAHTDATKRKIGDINRGNQYCLGYKHTKGARRNMGEAHKGNQNALGYKHTEEALCKMRGRAVSDETRCKLSRASKGRKLSEEHRRKISISLIGNQRTRGRKHTEAARRKIGEASRQMWARRRAESGAQLKLPLENYARD